MIHIGEYNTLEILRETSVGIFLGDDSGNDVLLPNKYVPKEFEIGQSITVFCYLDHEERPVATTLKPKVVKGEFALLKVVEVNNIGAFLDWGLEKHLFVPFREQARKMEQGKWYLVYVYEDEQTKRLVASSKTNQFVSNENVELVFNDQVQIIVSRFTDMGVEVIINNKYKGLIYNDELFEPLKLGSLHLGYIKKIREDQKIDISLKPQGYKAIQPASQKILDQLKDNNGYLALGDKSDPELIKMTLNLSKKSFKKAIGALYKEKLISIDPDGIRLK
ncbi:hypothetical protein I215_04025 [Galbibacter marinus]|uniref:S1 motif domain-containing protein n=1 Tax=Galbibacter marinus TaxID=555500 RepID=K2QMI4_9FLAO|nr:S1-like domain-containing RNA-binding protein [Galbibacter marinus]EKF56082.1 hypothetical protein I215_04025 [Galbibacter marinus]